MMNFYSVDHFMDTSFYQFHIHDYENERHQPDQSYLVGNFFNVIEAYHVINIE
jgi:hypothetical protein